MGNASERFRGLVGLVCDIKKKKWGTKRKWKQTAKCNEICTESSGGEVK
jgi:hypothetical protein